MASRHYAQFLDASDPDQSVDDDLRYPNTPKEILRGGFRIGFIPRDDSSYASTRYLLSVATPLGHLAFALEFSATTTVAVRLEGTLLVQSDPLTFSAGQELTFVFSAYDGTITVSGATTGDGEYDGDSWNLGNNIMRLGGNVDGSDVARGYVSLPYAVAGMPLGVDPSVGGGSSDGGALLVIL